MAAVPLQLCFLCLAWLIFSPGVAAEQEDVNDTDQSKQLVQPETEANGKNSKENHSDQKPSKDSGSSNKLVVTAPNHNRSLWQQNDQLCDIQYAFDAIRASGHRMPMETILRYCSIKTGFLVNRKQASARVTRRIARDVTQPQDSTIYYNNPKHLKMIHNVLRMESKLGTENQATRFSRLSKVGKRSINEFSYFTDDIPMYTGKRQPLDRIDEPNAWRDKLQPKYARMYDKRQPLDRIDEPNAWRDKLQPKYARMFDNRQPLDNIRTVV